MSLGKVSFYEILRQDYKKVLQQRMLRMKNENGKKNLDTLSM